MIRQAFKDRKMEIFCTTIIPTVGRAALVRAVESALQQEHLSFEFEVIVVNDSGQPLPAADWQQSERVQIIDTNRRERSIARNTGAAAARGKYLHFLDDDDWLAPGAFRYFYELSQSTNAAWLYGITQLVDRQNQPTIQLRHGLNGGCFLQTMAGEWIPLQSSFIERNTFMKVGGFNPQITGPEDIDMLRRVLLVADMAETPDLVAYVERGEEGSTTDYSQHAEAGRWAREGIIDAPGVYQRLRSSAEGPFWHGRMLRIYLTSCLWNFQHQQGFRAVSRLLYAAACLLTSGKHIFSSTYWKSVSGPYVSITFQRGHETARQANGMRLPN
jgi:glycosyltransferase involved in cell wall biosynthesis